MTHSAEIIGIGIIPLIGALGLVALLVWAFIKSGPAVRVVIGVGVLGFMVLVAGVSFWASPAHVVMVADDPLDLERVAPDPPPVRIETRAQSDELLQVTPMRVLAAQTDLFSSEAEAVGAALDGILPHRGTSWRGITHDGMQPRHAIIRAQRELAYPAVVAAQQKLIAATDGTLQVSIQSDWDGLTGDRHEDSELTSTPPTAPGADRADDLSSRREGHDDQTPGELVLEIGGQYEFGSSGPGMLEDSLRSGRLRLRLYGAGGERIQTVRFENRPWVSQFARHVVGCPGHVTFYVVGPSQLQPTQAEAREQLLNRAASHLYPSVKHRLNQLKPVGWDPDDASGRDRVLGVIKDELSAGRYIETAQVQHFKRPYGSVYQEVLLLRVEEPATANLLASAYADSMGAMFGALGRKAVSVVALVVLLGGVYLFLNAATKGYYVWSLRIATGLLIAAGVLGALLFV